MRTRAADLRLPTRHACAASLFPPVDARVRPGLSRPRVLDAGASRRRVRDVNPGHSPARRVYRSRHGGAGGAARRRHRRASQCDVRQRRRTDHWRSRPARGADRPRQSVDHRVDYRKSAPGLRRVSAGWRTPPPGAALQSHGSRPWNHDAAVEHDRAGRARSLPSPVARRAQLARAEARHRDCRRALHHLLPGFGVHAADAS